MSVLECRNISKIFPGTVALDHVSASFESGKVHALVGKNGSGKSTLLKIFSGAQPATQGEILLDGEVMRFDSTMDAFSKGVATVYQELSLIPSLTVTENVLIGRLPKKNKLIDWKSAHAKAKELLQELDIDIKEDSLVSELSMWQKQMIEIAKAMSFHPKVLQLDEPTSALAKHEVEALFKMVRALKEKDVIILYVSHKLQELWEIADTCTVIRDGKYIGKAIMKDTTRKELIDMMFGSVEIPSRPDDLMVSDDVVLEVKNLTRPGKFQDISFSLRRGEVLGIAGMLGSGRTELLKSIFGADPYQSGEVVFQGQSIRKSQIRKMKEQGMALTPEDRKTEGLILDASIANNLCYASLGRLSRYGFIKRKKESRYIQKQIDDLQIKVASPDLPVGSLSGGNQQKVVIGNWLNTTPSVMIFDEPSRGIDVNAKQQIFKIIWEQSRKGVASIMVSTELEELLEVCQRILIMREGKITGEIRPEEVSNEELYAICMGGEA
ncbi:sugar ABC transporter ATP-binding protein [Diplocloster modestus]|uniref:Sugar ABC transporter ATP-binding protein n=1 Tax=Diplocloster modestus TaxID=2850322 RepID=A0ABS6KEY1_9FIRM|nr:sugar ABC transporter ATP-binding protein [Diplocloster modestus]MBU9729090.1 sugar ABC transporter ATP-binding protein [Diplocloster modestus]